MERALRRFPLSLSGRRRTSGAQSVSGLSSTAGFAEETATRAEFALVNAKARAYIANMKYFIKELKRIAGVESRTDHGR
ncbi:MAG: hypothetical protein QM757_14445 [Paludibaculum sp.]